MPEISGISIEAWRQSPEEVREILNSFQRNPRGVKAEIIRAGRKIKLRATSGKRTFAQAGNLFTGGIDSFRIKNLKLDVPARETSDQLVCVRNLTENMLFPEVFWTLSPSSAKSVLTPDKVPTDLDRVALTPDQIIEFCANRRRLNELSKYGDATLFLFKIGDEFCVARVVIYGDRKPRLDLFGLDYIDEREPLMHHASRRDSLVIPAL